MKKLIAVVSCLALMSACTQEQADEPSAANNMQPQNTAAETGRPVGNPEHDWARDLIAMSAKWHPVTPVPDPVDIHVYTLCRAPLPGESPGPHGDLLFAKDGATPSNHVVVDPGARDFFYMHKDQYLPIDKPLPVGTTIIKEKYDDIENAKKRTQTNAYGVMIKREAGYNPTQGDWEYAYITMDEKGQIQDATRGKLTSCIDCHANRAETDYVFRSYPLLIKSE